MKVWYNIHKSINVINHLSELKNKNHIIISMYVKKAFDKVYHIFVIKVLERRELERTYISIIKICMRTKANIILISREINTEGEGGKTNIKDI